MYPTHHNSGQTWRTNTTTTLSEDGLMCGRNASDSCLCVCDWFYEYFCMLNSMHGRYNIKASKITVLFVLYACKMWSVYSNKIIYITFKETKHAKWQRPEKKKHLWKHFGRSKYEFVFGLMGLHKVDTAQVTWQSYDRQVQKPDTDY
jgi:hypothetical protein